MQALLTGHSHGKNDVRLLRVERTAAGDIVRDVSLDIKFLGAAAASYTAGDNRAVLPTDTMRNTALALAREHLRGAPECFARALVEHFLAGNDDVPGVEVTVRETRWQPLEGAPELPASAFGRTSEEVRTAAVLGMRTGLTERSGIRGLTLLKTRGAGFASFRRDSFTTLREAHERLLRTSLTAEWRYGPATLDHDEVFARARRSLLAVFASHTSLSLQHTAFTLGEALLASCPEIEEVHLSLPNLHCLSVEGTSPGIAEPSLVFVPIDEPRGVIEAHVARGVVGDARPPDAG